LPNLESILQKRENPDSFFLFCDNFLSRIVGISVWKEGCQKKKVSEMATISDEAFALLLMENYWDYWANLNLQDYKSEVVYDTGSNKKIKRTANWGKYTKIAYGARRYGGWTSSGLLRFNELFHQVKADRLKNGDVVEEEYLKYCVINNISPKKGQMQEIVKLLQLVKISLNIFNFINYYYIYGIYELFSIKINSKMHNYLFLKCKNLMKDLSKNHT